MKEEFELTEPIFSSRHFDTYEDFIIYHSMISGFDEEYVSSYFKKLKKLRMVSFSTKSKNKFSLKLTDELKTIIADEKLVSELNLKIEKMLDHDVSND